MIGGQGGDGDKTFALPQLQTPRKVHSGQRQPGPHHLAPGRRPGAVISVLFLLCLGLRCTVLCLQSCPSAFPFPAVFSASSLITFPGCKAWFGSQATQTQWGDSVVIVLRALVTNMLYVCLWGRGQESWRCRLGAVSGCVQDLLHSEQGHWGMIEGL